MKGPQLDPNWKTTVPSSEEKTQTDEIAFVLKIAPSQKNVDGCPANARDRGEPCDSNKTHQIPPPGHRNLVLKRIWWLMKLFLEIGHMTLANDWRKDPLQDKDVANGRLLRERFQVKS